MRRLFPYWLILFAAVCKILKRSQISFERFSFAMKCIKSFKRMLFCRSPDREDDQKPIEPIQDETPSGKKIKEKTVKLRSDLAPLRTFNSDFPQSKSRLPVPPTASGAKKRRRSTIQGRLSVRVLWLLSDLGYFTKISEKWVEKSNFFVFHQEVQYGMLPAYDVK